MILITFYQVCKDNAGSAVHMVQPAFLGENLR